MDNKRFVIRSKNRKRAYVIGIVCLLALVIFSTNAMAKRLVFKDSNGRVKKEFKDVDVRFTKVRDTEGRITEVRTDFKEPFRNTMLTSTSLQLECKTCLIETPGGSGVGWDKAGVSPSFSIVTGERFKKIIPVDDGYLLFGGLHQILIMKIDRHGNPQWSKVVKNSDPNWYTFLNAVLPVEDGYIIAGFTADSDWVEADSVHIQALLMKLDKDTFAPIWAKRFKRVGVPDRANKRALSDVKRVFTSGGQPDGYIAVGYSYDEIAHKEFPWPMSRADMYMLRVREDGGKIWEKAFGSKEERPDSATSIMFTHDSAGVHDGYLVIGTSEGFWTTTRSKYAVYVNRVSTDGDFGSGPNPTKRWSRHYYENGRYYHQGKVLMAEGDTFGMDGFLMAGTRLHMPTWSAECVVFKADASGNHLWTKGFGVNGRFDRCQAFKKVSDGYILLGDSMIKPIPGLQLFYTKIYLVKTDNDINYTWSRIYGDENSTNRCLDAVETYDSTGDFSGYLMAGYTDNYETNSLRGERGYIIKTDIEGRCPESRTPEIFGHNPEIIFYTSVPVGSMPGPANSYNTAFGRDANNSTVQNSWTKRDFLNPVSIERQQPD